MHGGSSDNGLKARCVVWCAPASSIPTELGAALDRPDFGVLHAQSEFDAVASICRKSDGPFRVLLVVEPARLKAIAQFLSILDRYAPDVIIWVYESAAPVRLRAASATDRAAWSTPPEPLKSEPRKTAAPVIQPATKKIAEDAVATTRVKMSQPKLRLAGEGPIDTPAPKNPTPHPEIKVAPASNNNPQQWEQTPETPPTRPAHLLTDEELAMLLATEPDAGHN